MASVTEKLQLSHELAGIREKLMGPGFIPPSDRDLLTQRLLELEAQRLTLAGAESQKPPDPVISAGLSPAQAAARAKEIRDGEAYWRGPNLPLKDGTMLTPDQHARLKTELLECEQRAAEVLS